MIGGGRRAAALQRRRLGDANLLLLMWWLLLVALMWRWCNGTAPICGCAGCTLAEQLRVHSACVMTRASQVLGPYPLKLGHASTVRTRGFVAFSSKQVV